MSLISQIRQKFSNQKVPEENGEVSIVKFERKEIAEEVAVVKGSEEEKPIKEKKKSPKKEKKSQKKEKKEKKPKKKGKQVEEASPRKRSKTSHRTDLS